MSEPMELVKEALLKTIKSQVPALSDLPFINDGNNALAELVALHQKQTDGINLSCDASMAAAPDVKQQHQQQPLVNDESENAIGLVKEQSRRKTRKPNKTSKVVNEEDEMVLPVVATGRVSTDVEEEDGGAGDVESNNKSGQGEIESMEKEKRNSNSSPAGRAVAVNRPMVDENGTPTTTKKKKRNRPSTIQLQIFQDKRHQPQRHRLKASPQRQLKSRTGRGLTMEILWWWRRSPTSHQLWIQWSPVSRTWRIN